MGVTAGLLQGLRDKEDAEVRVVARQDGDEAGVGERHPVDPRRPADDTVRWHSLRRSLVKLCRAEAIAPGCAP
jgi:hypothetical protein